MIGYKEFLVDLNETNFGRKTGDGVLVPKKDKRFEDRTKLGLVARHGLSITIDDVVVASQDDFNGEMPDRLREILSTMTNMQDKAYINQLFNRFVKEVSTKK